MGTPSTGRVSVTSSGASEASPQYTRYVANVRLSKSSRCRIELVTSRPASDNARLAAGASSAVMSPTQKRRDRCEPPQRRRDQPGGPPGNDGDIGAHRVELAVDDSSRDRFDLVAGIPGENRQSCLAIDFQEMRGCGGAVGRRREHQQVDIWRKLGRVEIVERTGSRAPGAIERDPCRLARRPHLGRRQPRRKRGDLRVGARLDLQDRDAFAMARQQALQRRAPRFNAVHGGGRRECQPYRHLASEESAEPIVERAIAHGSSHADQRSEWQRAARIERWKRIRD